jgi:hypothetical protein
VAVSALEHFGLGAYGQPSGPDERLDTAALAVIRDRLVSGGLLVLTVPCAPTPGQDEFQRTYSFAQLREMLSDWDIADLSVVWQRDRQTWIRGQPDDPEAQSGVALITARKPG